MAEFTLYDGVARGTALSMWIFYDKVEQFDAAINRCRKLQELAQSGVPLPEDFADQLKDLWQTSLPWDTSRWGADRQPWCRLPQDRELHNRAGQYHTAAHTMLLESAAVLGLTHCERLWSEGLPRKAAWSELAVLARRRFDPRMFPETYFKLITNPPQVVVNDETVAIDENALHYLRVLYEHFGERMSDSEVVAESEWLMVTFKRRPRLKPIRDSLPPSVKAWLDSSENGTKLRRPK